MSQEKSSELSKKATELEKSVEQGEFDTTDTPLRYLAFLARARPLLLPATRYLAYTSDVGEAFRPVVAPNFVRAAYGVSWLYLGGDVAYEGYKTHLAYKNQAQQSSVEMPSEAADVGLNIARRAVFQSVASMAFPALTIHSAVKHSAKYFSKSSSPRLRAWGPTSVGLAVVPFLPFIFDHPCEVAVDTVFDWIEVKTLGETVAAQNRMRRHARHHVKPAGEENTKTEL